MLKSQKHYSTYQPEVRKTKWWVRALKLLVWVSVGLLLLIFIGALTLTHAHGLITFDQFIHSHQVVFGIWRYGLTLALIYFYPKLITFYFSNKPNIDPVRLALVAKRRWIVLIFALYEVLFVFNLPAYIINYFLGL